MGFAKRASRYFVPKDSKPSTRRFATIDIEANDWTKFEMLAFYDGEEKHVSRDLRSFMEQILVKRYRRVWFYGHYAGRFDWLFFLQELNDHFRHLGFTYRIINQGSRIVQLRVARGKNNWYFMDSASLFPNCSLDALCKTFNTATKKLIGMIDFKNGERVDPNNRDHVAYMVNDAVALYEIIEKFLEDPKIKEEGLSMTLASQAMGMFRRMMKHPVKVSPQHASDFIRRGYVGGRVEIFKMRGEGLNYYDVNSLFPFALRSNPMPIEFNGSTDRMPDSGLFYADCTITAPEIYIPILPLKTDTKLLFPLGTFRGVFFSEELKIAVENGYVIEKVHEVHKYTQSTEFFSEYIDYWYNVKKNSAPGSAQYFTAKLYLNALYGKFGQVEKRNSLVLLDDLLNAHNGDLKKCPRYSYFHSDDLFEKTGLVVVETNKRSPHMLPHISAACTSYARIHMLKTCYLPNPEKCYYTDTDSLLTSMKLPTGPELGELKLESKKINGKSIPMENCRGLFLRPKGYEIRTCDGILLDRKLKGFPVDFIKNLTANEFENGKFVYREHRISTMKRSLISNGSFLSVEDIEKKVLSDYNKRRRLKGGETEPWVVKNMEVLNGKLEL